MTAFLTVLTVLETVVFLAVLAGYLIKIQRILRTIAQTLAKTAMGVRAIETQTDPIGSNLAVVNERLAALSGSFASLGDQVPSR